MRVPIIIGTKKSVVIDPEFCKFEEKNFMKKLITIFVVLSLISCGKEVPKTEIKKEKVPETEVWVSKNQKFLDKFKTIDFDTLKVFSSDDVYDDKKIEFRGKQLDVNDIKLFPKEVRLIDVDKVDAYSVYKFDIDKNYIGLIIRTPSEYWSSSIKLFIYDKNKEIVTNYEELGESIGDAGFHMDISSWIIKNNSSYKIFKWIYEYDDYSVEDENDKRIVKTNTYYLLKLNKEKFDTISKNNYELEKQFSKIIKKENHK